jgi:hypothetical protein
MDLPSCLYAQWPSAVIVMALVKLFACCVAWLSHRAAASSSKKSAIVGEPAHTMSWLLLYKNTRERLLDVYTTDS